MIAKRAEHDDRFRRTFVGFPNARSAFKAFLVAIGCVPTDYIALPSYIGWSPREGSGVLDPVVELGLKPVFYRMDSRLRIDLESFRSVVDGMPRPKVAVIIHYFGYRDPAYPYAVTIASRNDVQVVEDEAHAMLTDLIGGITGRLGAASILSLHKILPVRDGGALVLNGGGDAISNRSSSMFDSSPPASLWDFDLAAIAAGRIRNARLLTELLAPLSGEVDPLWGNPGDGEVPQSYPVLVRKVSRDQLYEALNEAGVGVVSLYHTLVPPLPTLYPDAARISREILNLPVHQDATPEQLTAAVGLLVDKVRNHG